MLLLKPRIIIFYFYFLISTWFPVVLFLFFLLVSKESLAFCCNFLQSIYLFLHSFVPFKTQTILTGEPISFPWIVFTIQSQRMFTSLAWQILNFLFLSDRSLNAVRILPQCLHLLPAKVCSLKSVILEYILHSREQGESDQSYFGQCSYNSVMLHLS